jgi:sigma-B regulation protein RsbU (phosphoserine phosphatase)
LNGLICEITPASRFSTLFYAHYAPEQRRLRYVNAGHNPPLLVREGRAMSLALCGPAIGLSRQARYEERSVDLAPGDLLVAFTDGVTEAMNAEREDFGEERLTAVLAEAAAQGEEAAEIVERVLAAVDRHAAGAAQHDDITLVVMGVLAV